MSLHLLQNHRIFLQGNAHLLVFCPFKNNEDIDLNALFNFLASRDAKFLRKQVAIWLASWFDFRKPNLNVTLSDATTGGILKNMRSCRNIGRNGIAKPYVLFFEVNESWEILEGIFLERVVGSC